MRFLVPLSVVLVVAAFHSALSASLESAEEEEVTQYDGLTQLQKIDQMEFDAAQKAEAAQLNITEEQQNEDSRFLEAGKDESVEEPHEDESEDESKDGAADSKGATEESDAESESESSEGTKGRQRREYPETSTLNCVLKGTPKKEMYN